MPLKIASANRKDLSTARNGVSLQHRHFAFIADVISYLPSEYRDEVTSAFEIACCSTNAKFSRSRFVAAYSAKSQ